MVIWTPQSTLTFISEDEGSDEVERAKWPATLWQNSSSLNFSWVYCKSIKCQVGRGVGKETQKWGCWTSERLCQGQKQRNSQIPPTVVSANEGKSGNGVAEIRKREQVLQGISKKSLLGRWDNQAEKGRSRHGWGRNSSLYMKRHPSPCFPEDSFKGHCGFRQRDSVKGGEGRVGGRTWLVEEARKQRTTVRVWGFILDVIGGRWWLETWECYFLCPPLPKVSWPLHVEMAQSEHWCIESCLSPCLYTVEVWLFVKNPRLDPTACSSRTSWL